MSSVIRDSQIFNTTGAPLGLANCDNADELAEVTEKRTFAAADVGVGADQTRDAATNPTQGCLCAQFSGSRILEVEISLIYRMQAGPNVTTFATPVIGVVAANTPATGYNVIYNPNLRLSYIYIFDNAAGAPGQIVAADWINLRVRLGNSATITPLG